MGVVRPGPPTDLVLLLRDQLGIDTFIETGTHRGRTAAWAARYFRRIVTFELSEALHRQAVDAHGTLDNAEFRFVDSRRGLAELVPTLDAPALFWLDSHWSGDATYGAGDECGLLDEIREITRSPHDHAVLIDDARLFESAPPKPHDPEQWPSIDQVIESLLQARHRPAIAIVEDVIVAVPEGARSLLRAYSQDVNAKAGKSISRGLLAHVKTSLGTGLLALRRLAQARRA